MGLKFSNGASGLMISGDMETIGRLWPDGAAYRMTGTPRGDRFEFREDPTSKKRRFSPNGADSMFVRLPSIEGLPPFGSTPAAARDDGTFVLLGKLGKLNPRTERITAREKEARAEEMATLDINAIRAAVAALNAAVAAHGLVLEVKDGVLSAKLSIA